MSCTEIFTYHIIIYIATMLEEAEISLNRKWALTQAKIAATSVVKLPYTQSYFDLSQILTYLGNVEATLLTEYMELFA